MINLFDFFNKNNKNCSCKFISSSLYFDAFNKILLCPYNQTEVIEERFDGLWFDIEKFLSIRKNAQSLFLNNEIKHQCLSCEYLEKSKIDIDLPLENLYLSNWKNCYVNCSYCEHPKEEDLFAANHYDVFPIIKQLLDTKIIDVKTKIIFECGDATIHPEFDKILYFFINYGMKNIVINTPALRYCESISEAIGKNIAEVIVSYDSGCPYIYEKIKGINKFDISTSNLKKYIASQEPKQRRVALKYVIINGINDNQKEILDWYIMARELGVRKLYLDIELKWYNQIKNSIPQYLKELISFANNISKYNDIEIEFSERASFVYSSTQKN